MDKKRLCKSSTHKMICGVCGGIGEYFGIDPTLIRLVTALFTIAGGAGVWFYLAAAIIMPSDPYER